MGSRSWGAKTGQPLSLIGSKLPFAAISLIVWVRRFQAGTILGMDVGFRGKQQDARERRLLR
jgi:hypothetical protein